MKVLKLALMISLGVLFLNSCTISNNNVNHAPVILSEPITVAYLDEEYNYGVNAIDEEGDILVYELNNSPEGMSIDINSGEIFWLPQTDQIGENAVVISVDDGELSAIQSFTIAVQENDPVNNDSVNIFLLELIPETVVVSTSTLFTIDIVVENVTELQGVNNLMAASITLNFDATKLEYVSSSPGAFFSSAFIMPPTLGSGSVRLEILTLAEKPSGTGTIMTVVFDALATGTTDLTFGTTELTNEDGEDIIHTQGSGCSVTIN